MVYSCRALRSPQNKHSVVCSDDDKLVYLLRCTCGPAKDAITMCALMEGRDGYQ